MSNTDNTTMLNGVNILSNMDKKSDDYNFKIFVDNNVLCGHILKYGNQFVEKKSCIAYSYGNKQQDFNVELMLSNGEHEILF